MEATTIKLTEKLMESHYGATPDFFEEDGAVTYCFTADENKELEISGTLHIYEDRMELRLEHYKQGQGEPFKMSDHSVTTFKELTKIIQSA